MKRRLLQSTMALLLLLNPAAIAENSTPKSQPVIVTASRTPQLEESIGKSVSVISGKELGQANDLSILDSLRQIPGVRAQQLGGPGNFTSIRIRGLRTSDTQLLINGLPFRDAAAPQGTVDGIFQDFRTDFLGQIEVVRGSNSTLFGSDAIGGSINLIPARPEGKPVLSIGAEGGTLNTYRQTYSVGGGEENLSYLLGYSRTTSDGIDSHDDYDNNFYNVNLTAAPLDNVEVGFDFVASDTRLDLNESPTLSGGRLVTGADDPNDFRDSEFFFYGTHVAVQATDNWEHVLRFGAVDSNKEFVFKVDPDGTDFASVSEFNGNTYNLEYQTNLELNDTHLATFGYEFEFEEFEQIAFDFGTKVKEDPDQYRNSWYLQDQMNFLDETLFVTGGIRITDHETAGTDVNGEGALAYLIREWGTKFHSHIGTGFRAPALFELFGASTFGGIRTVFGNRNLDPEQSLSWDIGVTQSLCNNSAELSVTYFQEDVDDLIVFSGGTYLNVDNAESQGIEVELKKRFTENLSGRAFYTFTDSEDPAGMKVAGIPEHLWGLDVLYQFLKKFTLLVRATYNGENNFDVFTFVPVPGTVRVEADEYFKVDAVLSCQVHENAEVYVRVENLFDEEIIENGFEGTPGMVFGGVKIKI